MNWVNPIVTLIESAMVAIQGQSPGSKVGVVIEGGHTRVTATAYEADE